MARSPVIDGLAAKVVADAEAKAAANAAAEAAAAAPAAMKRAAEAELQDHVVTRDVIHDGDLFVAGNAISLTFAQHAQLRGVGVIESDWCD